MNDAPGKEEQAFEGFIHQQPDILQCHNVSGKDSYMSKIRPDSLATLRRLPPGFESWPQSSGQSRLFPFDDQGSWQPIADNASQRGRYAFRARTGRHRGNAFRTRNGDPLQIGTGQISRPSIRDRSGFEGTSTGNGDGLRVGQVKLSAPFD